MMFHTKTISIFIATIVATCNNYHASGFAPVISTRQQTTTSLNIATSLPNVADILNLGGGSNNNNNKVNMYKCFVTKLILVHQHTRPILSSPFTARIHHRPYAPTKTIH